MLRSRAARLEVVDKDAISDARIFALDDETTNLFVLRALLETFGFDCVET
ncbi:MAG: hypothetical protein HYR64_05090 [Fimbriimonas ginsengisoli]|uniref:Uncharacterized protein n=1 Tax=Fimbriimonas ginsengisoli TaxID=1005039 RepID=A0A931PWB2_FIMGI|nr:hypothetical protein [Fimbriimonas ginsengisoli]